MSDRFKIDNGDSGGYSPPGYYKDQPLARIDVNSEESLAKWEAVLHMGRKELLEAISAYGPVVRDIRRGLLHKDEAA